jgi:hypothetical protein
MNVKGTFDSQGNLTLLFSQLTPVEYFHVGCLHGTLVKSKVPLRAGLTATGEIFLQLGNSEAADDNHREPQLPFPAAKAAAG